MSSRKTTITIREFTSAILEYISNRSSLAAPSKPTSKRVSKSASKHTSKITFDEALQSEQAKPPAELCYILTDEIQRWGKFDHNFKVLVIAVKYNGGVVKFNELLEKFGKLPYVGIRESEYRKVPEPGEEVPRRIYTKTKLRPYTDKKTGREGQCYDYEIVIADPLAPEVMQKAVELIEKWKEEHPHLKEEEEETADENRFDLSKLTAEDLII